MNGPSGRWTKAASRVAAGLLLVLVGCGHVGPLALDSTNPPERADAGAPPAPELPPPTETVEPAEGEPLLDSPPRPVAVWGVTGLRVFPYGQEVAPNGDEFSPLFSLDLDFNLMLWRSQGIYIYGDTRFWGQKPAPGVTNPNQGIFDFSKREFDFEGGLAWNYYGPWEARFFAYSFNNLNRGKSVVQPTGYTDGIGLEQRYYLHSSNAALGTEAFDVARATFLSVGDYPSKDMVDASGNKFHPGPFVRAYLTWGFWDGRCYLYLDTQGIATRSCTPKLLQADAGVAVRPFAGLPRVEFRVGSENSCDLGLDDVETSLYLSVRYVY
jgi:hypothetical protein